MKVSTAQTPPLYFYVKAQEVEFAHGPKNCTSTNISQYVETIQFLNVVSCNDDKP